ncbi:MAG: alpha/beta hydrolase [Planctomycetes bacterium]|nr:alpha/beta hydrolase [Planctomycetota bacterium]
MARKHVLRFLVAAFCAALAGCLAVENRLLYYPAAVTGNDLPLPAPLEDVTLALADGTKIHARWAPNPRATGAILYCHGNAGNLEQRATLVKELFDATGESVLIFDYPGYGRSEGAPSEAGCYASGQVAYDWLVRQKGVPPGRILLFGESLGGGVAVDLASRQPHRALILVRTFTSIPEVAEDQFPLLPGDLVVSNRFNNLKKLPMCKQPVFIAQADQDRVIPFRHGKKLLDACGGPADFCHLRNMGHNDPLPDEFYLALRRFLGKAPLLQ